MRTRQWLKAIRYVSYRIVVAGEMDIGFSSNRVQQASYPKPSSHKSRGEFGIKTIRYVSYPYAVVDEMAIGISPNRVQRASYLMPHSHKSRGEFGIREIRYVNYRVAVGPLVGQGCDRSELPCLSGAYYPSRP